MTENIPLSLATSEQELEKRLLEETDVDKLNNIINLFNLNIKRKDIVRTAKLNQLQDKVYDQIDKRLTYKADEFSNADLLSYFNTIQTTLNKADTTLDKVDTPSIKIVQNQLNISTQPTSGLDKFSRQRVTDAVQKILAMASEQQNVEETANLNEKNIEETANSVNVKFEEITPNECIKEELNDNQPTA